MKNLLYFFLITLLTVSGSISCSTQQGNVRTTDQSAIDKIQIGKTDKAEVRSLMGEPSTIIRQSGKETWEYNYTQANIGPKAFIPLGTLIGESPISVQTSNLKITFDKKGIVEDVVSTIGKS